MKIIAIITMIIDHVGLFYFHEYIILRVIGRIAMPIFTILAGYNFKGKLRLSILYYGSILYLIQLFIIVPSITMMNILIPIFLGQVFLKIFSRYLDNFYFSLFWIILLFYLFPLTYQKLDFGTMSILYMLGG